MNSTGKPATSGIISRGLRFLRRFDWPAYQFLAILLCPDRATVNVLTDILEQRGLTIHEVVLTYIISPRSPRGHL